MIRCSQCGVEIPGLTSNKQEWGYSLGNSMRFCTYGCMKTKQASIEAKRLETAKRKDAEKATKKNIKEVVSNMENTTVTAALEQQPAEALPVPPELPASMKAAIDDTVMLLLDKEEVTYLARMVEVRLLEIIPDGYDLDWLIGMVDLAKKLRKR